MAHKLNNRLRILLTLACSLLLLASLFVPWWTATARLPGGDAKARLTLYSFQFESADFTCKAVLMFYSYGNCPLLGSETGVAELSFYLFWCLVFLVLSFSLEMASLVPSLKGYASRIGWLLISPTLNIAGNLSFIAAVSTAGLKFVSGSPLYGSSEILTWSVSSGFILAVASNIVQLTKAYLARKSV